MHDDAAEAGGAAHRRPAPTAMADVRRVRDALELLVADDHWPLPKYREMLFPV